jgi:hypothetical protein
MISYILLFFILKWSTKVDIFNIKFILNILIFVDYFLFIFLDGGSTSFNLNIILG